jgi:hypothetical protein
MMYAKINALLNIFRIFCKVGKKSMIGAHTAGIRNVRVTIAMFVLIRVVIAAGVVEMDANDCSRNYRLNFDSQSRDQGIVGLINRLFMTVCLLFVGFGHC